MFFFLRDPVLTLTYKARKVRDVWMGEGVLVCWLTVGGMGDQNGPSIFFIFKYVDDQDVLILTWSTKLFESVR